MSALETFQQNLSTMMLPGPSAPVPSNLGTSMYLSAPMPAPVLPNPTLGNVMLSTPPVPAPPNLGTVMLSTPPVPAIQQMGTMMLSSPPSPPTSMRSSVMLQPATVATVPVPMQAYAPPTKIMQVRADPVLLNNHPSPRSWVDHAEIMQRHYTPQPGPEEPMLPPAYGSYTYGHRDTWWSRRVPVHEHNAGIMINAEFPMKESQYGQEIARDDLAIRNLHWRPMGHWVPPAKVDQDADWRRTHTVDDHLAHDLKPKGHVPDFQALKRFRQDPLQYGQSVNRNDRELEILDDQQLAEFLADPEAAIEGAISW